MSPIKFGTDGVRGVANQGILPEDAFAIGLAAGRYIQEQKLENRVVVGRDTRKSGSMLGAALAAGLCSAGVDVDTLGVIPTGAISTITRQNGYSLGFVISASHNPAPDNGIKIFAGNGKKLPSDGESRIVALTSEPFDDRPLGGRVGRIEPNPTVIQGYLQFLESIVPERLDGMKIAIDAAHGAGYFFGVQIFEKLGAQVVATGVNPDGVNINEEGGATKPETIQELTKSSGAVIGIAYDGDADRAVFSDSQGRLINGDRTMGIWSSHWRAAGQFDPAIIVGTVMSNGAFESYVKNHGVELQRADVGDKYVSALMEKLGAKVGGEQSGHIIFSERGPTGDGLVTALELVRVLRREGRGADSFVDEFENHPQLLINLQVDRKEGWDTNSAVMAVIQAGQEQLGDSGRVNVRASGTQPILRVMVECADADKRDHVASEIESTLLDQLGGKVYSKVDLTHALGD